MNGSSGFGFYASNVGTKDFYFIPATGTPTLTFPVTSKIVDAETTSVEFTYTSAFLAGTPGVSVTSDAGSAVADTDIADGTLTVTLNENTTASDKSITLTVSAAGVSNVVLSITQAGAVGDASNGDTLWAEAFSGFSDSDVPTASNGSTTVYGSKSVTYACVNGASATKVYGNDNLAGGVKPELLVSKTDGSFTVSGIPTGNATGMTLSFKANNGNIVVSSSTPSATIGSNIGSTNAPVYGISVPGGTKTLTLTFSNAGSGNTRIDDLLVVAGTPVPGITVTTAAASATATAGGTTATLNGTLALVNGAVNSSVTSAGFYYKASASLGDYTKVTCASAPTSTTSFSYDLTSLTTDTEYTYYAWAIYDSGSEVTGTATEQTFTPTVSGGTTDYTTTWTATSGALGSGIGSGTINTTTSGTGATQSWSYTRTLSSGSSYTGWSSNCIQLGKNGGVENLTLTTSNIPGTIKSVYVECSSYSAKHNVSITVGGTTYLASTATASWTTVDSKGGTGSSSGTITISFTGGSRALYIKSITVVYNN